MLEPCMTHRYGMRPKFLIMVSLYMLFEAQSLFLRIFYRIIVIIVIDMNYFMINYLAAIMEDICKIIF